MESKDSADSTWILKANTTVCSASSPWTQGSFGKGQPCNNDLSLQRSRRPLPQPLLPLSVWVPCVSLPVACLSDLAEAWSSTDLFILMILLSVHLFSCCFSLSQSKKKNLESGFWFEKHMSYGFFLSSFTRSTLGQCLNFCVSCAIETIIRQTLASPKSASIHLQMYFFLICIVTTLIMLYRVRVTFVFVFLFKLRVY